jgi:hypothetical protein
MVLADEQESLGAIFGHFQLAPPLPASQVEFQVSLQVSLIVIRHPGA